MSFLKSLVWRDCSPIAAWVTRVLPAVALGVLAGCGGGGTDAGTTTSDAGAPLKAGQGMDVSGSGTGWTQVAVENQNFSVDGTQVVRYGSDSSWVAMSVTGGGSCSNAFFGTDPLYGVVKRCEVQSSWTRIAGEGETFSINGTQTVRYGSGSSWITKTVVDGGECSNGYFGSDPLYGVVKQCEIASAAATPPPASTGTWTRIAGEGESFAITGTQTVRYGSGASWVSRSVTNAGQCTNDYFGTDPIVGTFKQCEVSGAVASVAGVCTPPVTAVDTSGTAASVGDGTPASCTESALRAAIANHDVVTFNCGADPVTIAIGSQIDVPAARNTVIDGGGKVTLDGGHRTRILSLINLDYRRNSNGLTLQRITLANGQAPGNGYRAADPSRPQCAWGYAEGNGGAIEVRDARLHVVDVEFRNNASASPGPEVGGGAIYAMGSLDVTVVGSRFFGNTGANAGAIGLLQSNGRFVNTVFQGNAADGTGSGRYDADPSCPILVHSGQTGAGGIGGAVAIDGSDDTDLLVCGSRFIDNRANELSGALQRTANIEPRRTTIDRSLFQGNRARQAGALFISNAQPLAIQASTFSNNAAESGGAAQFERSRLDVVNSTFAGNQATRGVGGALLLGSVETGSSIRNATFASNQSSGGAGYFSAAIFGQFDFPVNNTVFSNNVTNDPWNPMQCTFAPTTGSGDMQWPRNRVAGGAPDTLCVQGIAFGDPALGAIGDNGGPTPTLLPGGGSALRGAGQNCPATDQRGMPRPATGCTIGAVE